MKTIQLDKKLLPAIKSIAQGSSGPDLKIAEDQIVQSVLDHAKQIGIADAIVFTRSFEVLYVEPQSRLRITIDPEKVPQYIEFIKINTEIFRLADDRAEILENYWRSPEQIKNEHFWLRAPRIATLNRWASYRPLDSGYPNGNISSGKVYTDEQIRNYQAQIKIDQVLFDANAVRFNAYLETGRSADSRDRNLAVKTIIEKIIEAINEVLAGIERRLEWTTEYRAKLTPEYIAQYIQTKRITALQSAEVQALVKEVGYPIARDSNSLALDQIPHDLKVVILNLIIANKQEAKI